jgi:subtilisin family serine protease
LSQDSDTLNLVRGDQNVDFVETEQLLTRRPMPSSSPLPDYPSSNSSAASAKAKRDYRSTVDISAPFNLQMIGAGAKLKTPVYDGGDYVYIQAAGRGVNIYILDTGVRISHSAFGGRARNFGGLKSTDNSPYCDNEQMADFEGHGTQ